ncbi:MAG: orotidine 5'-phosphate decarboxylase, partial [Enterobacterales bacterium]|nr:orotidine 5'-phosphate decarboxylase [Enterobacterales bacterium]
MSISMPSQANAITSPILVALDYADKNAALAFVDNIAPRDCRLKVGKEMFTLFGPQ